MDDYPGRRILDYRYKNLDPRRWEFRILILSRVESADSLSGTLEVVSMLDTLRPEYKTLSYAWGDATPSNVIWLDGRCLRIPESAEIALRGVLEHGYSGAIWIDAICINQGNVREREQQVSMMGGAMGIYQHTRLNLVWLGRDDGSSLQTVEAIEMIQDDMRRACHGEPDKLDEFILDTKTGEKFYSQTPFSSTFDHDLILRFFKRDWFSRLWVVQEAVLAPRSLVLFGLYELRLTDILRVARWCTYKIYYLEPRDHSLDPRSCLETPSLLSELVEERAKSNEERVEPDLIQCLQMSRYFDTTLPVDKVYATLGLLAPSLRASKLLRPDYAKPLVVVLRDVTYAAGHGSGARIGWDSDILRDVSHVSQEAVEGQVIPSWVPAWHSPYNELLEPCYLKYLFSASAGLWPLGPSHGTLVGSDLILEGILLDAIAKVSQTYHGTDFNEAKIERFVLECRQLHSEVHSQISDAYSIARTLIAGTTVQGRLAQQEDVDAFKHWYAHIRDRRYFPPIRRSHYTNDTNAVAASRYHEAFRDCCSKRRFFTTANGLIGIGPQFIRADDYVVILVSADLPFILRKDGDVYHLVGESYVDGNIMFGEAVEQHLEAGRENVLFRIR